MSDLNAKIQALQDELENLRRQKMIEDAELAKLTPDQRLAQLMHKQMCKANHIDQCGWDYEGNKDGTDWQGSEHMRWLGKAKKLRPICAMYNLSPETIVELFVTMRDL